MQSIVSLLDERHREIVRCLWAELDSKFIQQGFCPIPYPHISFHVAEGYDAAHVRQALARTASASKPLRVLTSGLGIFTGLAHPVIYLTVVRDSALTELHARVWEEVQGAYSEGNAHYEPSRWIPHITLAQGEVLKERLPDIIQLLWQRDFTWEIVIESLSLIYDDGERQGVEMSFDLT